MSQERDDFNKGGFSAFLFAMVFTFGFFIYIGYLHPGVDLDKVRSQETDGATQKVAQEADSAAADVSQVSDPWNSSEALIAHGQKAYMTNCAFCHGNTGAGDGPAGMALNPRPRNFIEGKWTVGGDRSNLYKSIKNGIPGTSMAAFGHLPKTDRWAMVHYIRSITKNKVDDSDAKVAEFAKTAE